MFICISPNVFEIPSGVPPAAAGTKFGPGVYVAESSSKPALDGKNTTARTAARGAANRYVFSNCKVEQNLF